MLATILKSPQAVQATLAIIETFSKIRELSRNIKTLSNIKDKTEQQNLMQKSGEIDRRNSLMTTCKRAIQRHPSSSFGYLLPHEPALLGYGKQT